MMILFQLTDYDDNFHVSRCILSLLDLMSLTMHDSVRMSCWIKRLLAYILTRMAFMCCSISTVLNVYWLINLLFSTAN